MDTSARRLLDLLLIALAIGLIAVARPRVASTAAEVKERSDSYTLPPPSVLPAVSMGYKQALADMLWAHVLVTQGLRFSEKRPFDHLPLYLDAIATLAPKFYEPYKYADSLLAFQTNDSNKIENIRSARAFVERGLREFPNDADLWMNYGEFLAYVAPSALKDQQETEHWRQDGAAALMRAGELGSRNEYLMWHAVSAVGLLSDRETERAALIRFLERVYAMTEDIELREHVLRKLRGLAADQSKSRMIAHQRSFDELWRPMGFLSRTQYRILGPRCSAWECAGPIREAADRERCLRNWSAWSRSLEPKQ